MTVFVTINDSISDVNTNLNDYVKNNLENLEK